MTTTQQVLDGIYQHVVATINQQRAQAGKAELNDQEKTEILQFLNARGVYLTKLFEVTTVYDQEYVQKSIEDNCSDPTIVDLIKKYVGAIFS